jgi:hypothetical protein
MGCLGTLLGLLGWTGICAIIGAIVSAVTGIKILFWVVAIVLFLFGLPGLLISEIFSGIGDFIQSENEYAQDRADYRELMHDIAEDERMDRYLDKLDDLSDDYEDEPDIYIDNRQIHFHNYSDKSRPRGEKNRFISKEKRK